MKARIRKLMLFILLLSWSLVACQGDANPRSRNKVDRDMITVFAAASLAEAMNQVATQFEATHPGIEVIINFAGSQQLAHQLFQGASADVFASADKQQMENVIHAGRVNPGSEQVFINNRLTIVLPGDNPGDVYRFTDLSRPGLHVLLANEAVPVGRYSLEVLERASKQPEFGEDFKDEVLLNVVSYEENVRAVLTKIILGEADAGIVYQSDIVGVARDDLIQLEIPESINVIASYYVAPLIDSHNPELGMDFIRALLSPEGRKTLGEFGFSYEGQHE